MKQIKKNRIRREKSRIIAEGSFFLVKGNKQKQTLIRIELNKWCHCEEQIGSNKDACVFSDFVFFFAF